MLPKTLSRYEVLVKRRNTSLMRDVIAESSTLQVSPHDRVLSFCLNATIDDTVALLVLSLAPTYHMLVPKELFGPLSL